MSYLFTILVIAVIFGLMGVAEKVLEWRERHGSR